MSDVTCEQFDLRLEELALGHVDEPERGRLLAHGTTCAGCRAQLTEMIDLTDRLLLLAPSRDPEPGFESRALARHDAQRVGRGSGRWWVAASAAAALIVGLVLGGLAVARRDDNGPTTRSAVIVSLAGERSGEVHLVDGDPPYVVVEVDRPREGSREIYCELVLADGRTARVGSWDAEDVRAHVWAVGIDPHWLEAVRMNVTLEDGTVLASAEFA